ncbi:hypothetical protein DFH28DRAFT_405400 [Melampsora americana]|nr:hypothetical protein DFH28DRAFT_405400 [Melampsora americana]
MNHSLPKARRYKSSQSAFSKYERIHIQSKATRSKTMRISSLFTFFVLSSCFLGLIQCLPSLMVRPEVEASEIKLIAEGTKPEIKLIDEGKKPEIKLIDEGKKPVMPEPPKPTEKELLSLEAEKEDLLLKKVPFKYYVSDTTKDGLQKAEHLKIDEPPRVDYFEVYRPPQIDPPEHGRYQIEYKDDMQKALDFAPERAQGQYIFDGLIKNQIEKQIRDKSISRSDQNLLKILVSRTSHLYGFSEPEPTFFERITNGLSFHKTEPSTPLSLMKETVKEFKRVNYKISLRQELWTLIIFHSFHSNEVENELIRLYRTDEFRKVMIEFIYKLTNFEKKENGLSWPIHEEILKIEQNEMFQLKNVPSYHNFIKFHSYLLKRTHNELMELLDREVLISQLENHQIHSDATQVLKGLRSNWRELESNEETARQLAIKIKGKIDESDSKLDAIELQGGMNVLLHLRAFGSDKLKRMIEDFFEITKP